MGEPVWSNAWFKIPKTWIDTKEDDLMLKTGVDSPAQEARRVLSKIYEEFYDYTEVDASDLEDGAVLLTMAGSWNYGIDGSGVACLTGAPFWCKTDSGPEWDAIEWMRAGGEDAEVEVAESSDCGDVVLGASTWKKMQEECSSLPDLLERIRTYFDLCNVERLRAADIQHLWNLSELAPDPPVDEFSDERGVL